MQVKEICKTKCTGCAACAAVCPVSAIKLKENENGFREPVVDSIRCINCNLCVKVCNKDNTYNDVIKACIAKHDRTDVHQLSQSGGAFTAISDFILGQGGVVYGAVFDDNFEVKHIRATVPSNRDKMRGSKYLQSNIDAVYQQMERDLKNERIVLFVGTGCQAAGVLRFLKQKKVDVSNLYTVDILCHGVPSVFIWRDTIQYLREKYKADILSIELKEVEENTRPIMCIKIGEKEIPDIVYRKLYYSNLALRESCYYCQYARTIRVSDITIGDAWGVEKANPAFNDRRGVSLILFNSNKGMKAEKFITENMRIEEIDINNYLQECLVSSAKTKRKTSEFWKDYHRKSFVYIIEKYAKHNPFFNIPYIFMRIYKRIIEGR